MGNGDYSEHLPALYSWPCTFRQVTMCLTALCNSVSPGDQVFQAYTSLRQVLQTIRTHILFPLKSGRPFILLMLAATTCSVLVSHCKLSLHKLDLDSNRDRNRSKKRISTFPPPAQQHSLYPALKCNTQGRYRRAKTSQNLYLGYYYTCFRTLRSLVKMIQIQCNFAHFLESLSLGYPWVLEKIGTL